MVGRAQELALAAAGRRRRGASVCSRSPWATAAMARVTSVVGHSRSSISVLTERLHVAPGAGGRRRSARAAGSCPRLPTTWPTRSQLRRAMRWLAATMSLKVSAILPRSPVQSPAGAPRNRRPAWRPGWPANPVIRCFRPPRSRGEEAPASGYVLRAGGPEHLVFHGAPPRALDQLGRGVLAPTHPAHQDEGAIRSTRLQKCVYFSTESA